MNGILTAWVCWHPDLGFLTFRSYRVADVSEAPNPRGTYARRADAERRRGKDFWHARTKYPGSSIQVREVTFTWEVAP